MRNLFIVYLMINSHLLFAKEDTSRTEVFENDSVYCIKFYPITSGPFVNEKFVNFDAGVSISCISKVSIAKDLLEIEVLRLQKTKLEKELSKIK